MKSENPIISLAVNIFLPVAFLNKGGKYLSAEWTLVLALLPPLIYGLFDYVKNSHKNYVSLMGVVNILLSGGLALLKLTGGWFAVKEALLPTVLGIMTWYSAKTKQPAAKLMFFNPSVMNIELIEARLRERQTEEQSASLFQKTTHWLAGSFFISAAANFFLALWVFKSIDISLSAEAQAEVLNAQLAEMTWLGFVVIALPLMLLTGFLIYRLLNELGRLTGEPLENLMQAQKSK